MSESNLTHALMDFCETIESTGGLMLDPENGVDYVPKADDEWIDLADSYLKDCKALGRKPMIDEE